MTADMLTAYATDCGLDTNDWAINEHAITIPNRTNAHTTFEHLYDYLHHGTPLHNADMNRLFGMYAAWGNFRDPILAAAIRPDKVDADMMDAFTFDVDKPENMDRITRLVNDAGQYGDGWDTEVARRFAQLIDRLIAKCEGILAHADAQLHVSRAYVAWYMGDTETVLTHACKAQEAEKNNLAAILVQQVKDGAYPAPAYLR